MARGRPFFYCSPIPEKMNLTRSQRSRQRKTLLTPLTPCETFCSFLPLAKVARRPDNGAARPFLPSTRTLMHLRTLAPAAALLLAARLLHAQDAPAPATSFAEPSLSPDAGEI